VKSKSSECDISLKITPFPLGISTESLLLHLFDFNEGEFKIWRPLDPLPVFRPFQSVCVTIGTNFYENITKNLILYLKRGMLLSHPTLVCW